MCEEKKISYLSAIQGFPFFDWWLLVVDDLGQANGTGSDNKHRRMAIY